MKLITTVTAAATLAAGLIAVTIVADPPADEVAGTPVAAPASTAPTTGVIHIPGPPGGATDPACAELNKQRAAARAAGIPTIVVPTELMKCTGPLNR